MPITAKLSQEFYERIGEKVVNELVDWFNSVDTTYRADLRELNERNFARFDAKLEQRLAQFEMGLKTEFAAKLDARFDRFAAEQTSRFDALLSEKIADLRAELIKWIFLFWAGTALGGLLLR